MQRAEDQINECLAAYAAEIRDLAQALRIFLKKETRPGYELAGVSGLSLNLGYGFTLAEWDCYCAIMVYPTHINLSFPSGAMLPDPKGLLQGTGSRVRYLRIQSPEIFKSKPLRELLKVARERARVLAPDGLPGPEELRVVMKYSGPKPDWPHDPPGPGRALGSDHPG